MAVITGASAGVARATARALVQRGWSLGLLARGQKRLDATLADAESSGASAIVVGSSAAVAQFLRIQFVDR